ncbi:MAG: PAS domain S-box protein, partial [Candidatus Omnitrophica bacterium]|nr:PAS domain S-box protein [Candidatus Omnitrophota bacterium]
MVFLVIKNPRSIINKTCAAFLACFAGWSFSNIFINNPDTSKDTAMLYTNISSIGWASFSSFFLLFSLALTKKEKLLKVKIIYPIIFALPLLFIYKQWTRLLIVRHVRYPYGWANIWSESIWSYLFYIYYFLFIIAGIYLIFDFRRKTEKAIEKKQAGIIFTVTIISLFLASLTDVILPELNIYVIPNIGDIVILIWGIGLVYAIVKYKLMVLTPATAADNIISTMNDSLILLDKDRNIITVNKATQGLLGYKKKELEAKPLDICLREEKSKSTLIDKITKGETISEYDIAFQTKKGKYIPVSFSSSTLRDEAGGISGVVCIARNMTERKQAEENLKIAYAKLKQTQEQLIQAEKFKAIGELASGIAHEVKNPLAIISQGVNYLENKVPVKENISEILDMLKSNVKRANDIIRSLVDFSRVTELNLQTEDINAILESAVTLVEHMVKLESIKFVKQLNTDLPLVSVDKGKMEQVFLNLFLNAIQAMPKGGTL